MLRILLVGVSLFAATVGNAKEDEHLLPEHAVITDYHIVGDRFIADYYRNLIQVLSEAFEPNVAGTMISVSHGLVSNESAIALKKHEDSYRILEVQAQSSVKLFSSLGYYKNLDEAAARKKACETYECHPETVDDFQVELCERPLTKPLGEKLYVLWGEMLFRTRYRDKRPVDPNLDLVPTINFRGVTYHFSFKYPHERMVGQIWSPDPESNTGQFVAIAELMKDACRAEDNEEILSDIERRTDDLLETLSKTVY